MSSTEKTKWRGSWKRLTAEDLHLNDTLNKEIQENTSFHEKPNDGRIDSMRKINKWLLEEDKRRRGSKIIKENLIGCYSLSGNCLVSMTNVLNKYFDSVWKLCNTVQLLAVKDDDEKRKTFGETVAAQKVINAVPVVDFGPPPQRRHVAVKLKKLQKERERQMKIEEDNFKLLQHLGSIMRKKRVDNVWESEPPTFLRRVGIYHRTRSPSPCEEISSVITPETSTTRKSRCLACTPHHDPVPKLEERIPWEPPKKILTRRLSGSAVVPVTSDFDFPRVKKRPSENVGKVDGKKNQKVCEAKPLNKNSGKLPTIPSDKRLEGVEGSHQRIVLHQGPLQISVNFPSFAEVKLIRGKSEKFLQRNFCQCKSFRPIK